MKILIYDTETTGKPRNYKASYEDVDNWPRLVMLNWDVWEFSWVEETLIGKIYHNNQRLLGRHVNIIKPDDFIIPTEASNIHGITQEKAEAEGRPLIDVLKEFKADAAGCEYIGGHNIINFDSNVVNAEFERLKNKMMKRLESADSDEDAKVIVSEYEWVITPNPAHEYIDTMLSSTNYCKLPGKFGYKWPKLQELHVKLFGKEFEGAHTEGDVPATAACLFELLKLDVVKL